MRRLSNGGPELVFTICDADNFRPEPDRPDRHVEDGKLPEKVKCAFNFIAMCNQMMGQEAVVNQVTGQVTTLHGELHFKQESAFLLACDVMGKYFAGK